ncbi:uncharacterized protein LOC119077848 isoform X2 [Bradysia coprophila]|uniref:uncharacterized protein LOC119077848 isoform X2 n=1 Tax=Bradysia coprophila TaxID=38358 RepID=UPI00187DA470|nr:uncharacterized protein LOC119077848 isoform X2 [Bradysia coprophila]
MNTSFIIMIVFSFVLTILPLISAHQSTDTIYISQLEKCLRNIELIPRNVSANFDIKIEKNHIQLTVRNDDKFDYYEMNWKGYCCYIARGLNVTPIRTEEEQENCDNYAAGEKMDFYNYRCAYEIFDDKSYSLMVIHPNEGSAEADVYRVHKGTGEIHYSNYEQFYSDLELRVPHDESDDVDQFLTEINECLDKRNSIPESLPITFGITKRNSHIEILAQYENRFDFYKINWEGVYCHREIGEHRKSNATVKVDNGRCDNRPLSTHHGYGTFGCAYDIWTTVYDNDDYIVFYIEQSTDGTLGSNAYVINMSTNKVVFHDFIDSFTGESIFEEYKKHDSTISLKECTNKQLQLPEHVPFKFQMIAKNRTTEILISYGNKIDYYDISWNGTVRTFERRLDDIPVKKLDELSNDWEDADEEFQCPYSIVDDRDYSVLVIESTTSEGYAYAINKESTAVSFKFYPNYYHECQLEVPQSKIDESDEFDDEIENCVKRHNLIPSVMNASIVRINNHIRITVYYDGKYDYYEINYKGFTCYVERELTEPINRTVEAAVQDCEKRRITPCIDTVHTFSCGLEILHPANDHYVALNILSGPFDASTSYWGSYTYLLDKGTSEVDYRRYDQYNKDEILVKQSESDKSAVYVTEFEECLNLRHAIPSDLPLKFNVTKANNHINILVYDDGKYDYYEHNVRGEACYTAVRKAMNPTRTFEEQMKCDARRLKGSLKPYTETYQPEFRCGYEVIKNETAVIIFVHSTDGVYEYNVDRGSGKTELYLYAVFGESFVEQQIKCQKKKHVADFDIPLQVTMKPKNLDTNENYLEILVEYQGLYDLYVTEESGNVRYTEMQLAHRPNHSLSVYRNKTQCQQNVEFRLYNIKNFRCPLKVVENMNYVNVSVNAFHYENVYTIDKSNNAIKYFKVKDNLILSNLPIPDAKLNYISDVDECMDILLNLTGPFPVDVVRNKNFLRISVEFNGTFDVYETTSSGREMCRMYRNLLEKPPIAMQSLEDIYPDCVSCDEPAFTFTCPSFIVNEDENEITLKISYGPGFGLATNTYTLLKGSGEIFFGVSGSLGPPNLSNVIKSLVG